MKVRAGTPFLPGCSPQPLQGPFPGLWGRRSLYSSIWGSRAEIEARRFFVGEPGPLLGKCKWTGRGRWGEGSKGPSGAAQGPCSHRGSSVGPCPGPGPVSCRLGVVPVPRPPRCPVSPRPPAQPGPPLTLFSAPSAGTSILPPSPASRPLPGALPAVGLAAACPTGTLAGWWGGWTERAHWVHTGLQNQSSQLRPQTASDLHISPVGVPGLLGSGGEAGVPSPPGTPELGEESLPWPSETGHLLQGLVKAFPSPRTWSPEL